MMSAQMKASVRRLDPTQDVSILVSVKVADEKVEKAREAATARERRSLLFGLYQEVKQPIIDTLTDYSSDGLRIINELNGTPQLIVAAPAGVWEKLIADDSTLLGNPDVDMRPNEATAVLID
ncbi:MAG: hypothetical protein ACK4HG_08920 [Agrobacterium albertimagni]|jgi:hypothetical protein|uniref:Uncharacterized protein n=1 Tax=Agrobacterium albertimagni AOL15 TaxID=1156935 RepID=K2PZ21_9HYPH|nr:hypothetical protein [Agrobacterium albertimagni]EKF58050.1 hypothetical protein QWE_15648 [Agrobacterium albertimagni AOL15]